MFYKKVSIIIYSYSILQSRQYISKEVLLIRIHPCFNRLELDFLLYFSDKNIENLFNSQPFTFLKAGFGGKVPNSILRFKFDTILSQTGTFGGNNNFVSFSLILLYCRLTSSLVPTRFFWKPKQIFCHSLNEKMALLNRFKQRLDVVFSFDGKVPPPP